MTIRTDTPIANDSTNFTKLILELAEEEGMDASLFSDGWIIRISFQGKTRYIHGYQFGINCAASANICNDKGALSELLTSAGIPNVEHDCFMSPMDMRYARPDGNWTKLLSLFERSGSVICKNNNGTGGEEVYHAHSLLELEHYSQRIFATCPSMAVSPYYPLEHEYRVILLDGEPCLAYEKIRPFLTGNGRETVWELYSQYLSCTPASLAHQAHIPLEDAGRILKKDEPYFLNWKHNLGQGACADILYDCSVTKDSQNVSGRCTALVESLSSIAGNAAETVGIRFASIDIVKVKGEDSLRILEINSGVMMEYLSGAKKASRAVAKAIYRKALYKMFES